MFDLIIIGAGPAGITAGVYAIRKRMEVLVIAEEIGGQTAWSGGIENYTGYQFITGPELTAKFEEHIKKYNVQLKEGEIVTDIEKQGNIVSVKTSKNTYQAKAVIVASGARPRELNTPGEKEFKNKGLTYCATCDAPLFSNKDVAVVGGGNSALDAVLQLIKIANHIYLINIAPKLTGDKIMQDKIMMSSKVTVLNNTQVSAVSGDKLVTSIRINTDGKESTLPVQGVFVEIGLTPNSEFAKILEKNDRGEIKINAYNETSTPGVFAAGDVTDVADKQIIIAAGEGSKAALSAFKHLSRL